MNETIVGYISDEENYNPEEGNVKISELFGAMTRAAQDGTFGMRDPFVLIAQGKIHYSATREFDGVSMVTTRLDMMKAYSNIFGNVPKASSNEENTPAFVKYIFGLERMPEKVTAFVFKPTKD